LARVPCEKQQKLIKKGMKNPLMKMIKIQLQLDKATGFNLKGVMPTDEILRWLHKLMADKV
jgi:hypothetical protein